MPKSTQEETESTDREIADRSLLSSTDWPSGVGMVYFGPMLWEGLWRSRHQLMSRFAKQMPVIYVEPWRYVREWRTGQISLKNFASDLGQVSLQHVGDQLHIHRSSKYLPVSTGAHLLADITKNLWLSAVMKSLVSIGITRPILWISHPDMRWVVDRMGEILSIYHCVDEYTGYTEVDTVKTNKINFDEQRLLDSVDLTIAVSPELVEAKYGPNRTIVLMENAVDADRFGQARERALVPKSLARIPAPRIGYCGLIGKRLNLRLLESMARQEPNWSIVLIGEVDSRRCESEISALENLPNVYFLGQVPPEDVPAFVAGLNVGLLPYEINIETTNISPLKMYEYLAVGIPIVATDIPSTRRKEAIVAVADNTEFVMKCRQALEGDTREAALDRIAEAKANTWDHRIQQVSQIIREHLD